jgi:heme exporter protein A
MPAAKRLFSKTLTLSDITCQRGGRVLFQNFSLDAPAGTVVRLTGRNGAGKSSLLRQVAKALPVMQGRILWDAVDISEIEAESYAENYAFLPADDRDLKLLETAMENLLFWAALWKIKTPQAAAQQALSAIGLSNLADVPVRIFSAGQKRRLSIARVLMKQSALWLLDEPFNALDDVAAAQLATAIQAHAVSGGIVLMAAHQAPDMERSLTLRMGAAA